MKIFSIFWKFSSITYHFLFTFWSWYSILKLSTHPSYKFHNKINFSRHFYEFEKLFFSYVRFWWLYRNTYKDPHYFYMLMRTIFGRCLNREKGNEKKNTLLDETQSEWPTMSPISGRQNWFRLLGKKNNISYVNESYDIDIWPMGQVH